MLGGLVAVHFLVLVSPGPNFLIVTQTAVRYNRAAGIAASFGIASGVLVWSTCASLGLDALFTNFPWLHGILKVFGGVYLAYVGFMLWRSADKPLTPTEDSTRPTHWKSYRLGLLTNLTNPKAAIFFGSVFTALLPPDAPTWARVAAIGIVVTNCLLFHALLAAFLSTEHTKLISGRIRRWVDRVSGGVLSVFGIRLIVDGFAEE